MTRKSPSLPWQIIKITEHTLISQSDLKVDMSTDRELLKFNYKYSVQPICDLMS